MTDDEASPDHIDPCGRRIPRPEGGSHVCRLERDHAGPHHCTCPQEWAERPVLQTAATP